MKKKPQTAATSTASQSLDIYSSGSIIGNDPYSMRGSYSASSRSTNFGNMFQSVNSLLGGGSNKQAPTTQVDVSNKPSSITTSSNNQKTTKPTPTTIVNTKKPVIETEYESSSDNDSFNMKTLEDLSDFSDEEEEMVTTKPLPATFKEPPKKSPSTTPTTNQVRQPVAVQNQPAAKKQEYHHQPTVVSKPLYREPPVSIVHEMEEDEVSEDENFSEDDFSDFGDDEEMVEEDNDGHNTTQETSFADFEEEIEDTDQIPSNNKNLKDDEEDFSDFEDTNESFEDTYFETSNDSFEDFEEPEEEPKKVEIQKPITIPTTIKQEPIVNNNKIEPKKVEPVKKEPPTKPTTIIQQAEDSNIRTVSRSPIPITNPVPVEKPKETPKENPQTTPKEPSQPQKQVEVVENKVPELPIERTIIERCIDDIPETVIRRQSEVTAPVTRENKDPPVQTITIPAIERPIEKPKEVHCVSIGTDDMSCKESRTYATQTAFHSQVFNTSTYNNSTTNTSNNCAPPQKHMMNHSCCEHCNCHLYSPNFVPYYPPPLAYFRQPYAQAFPQRPLSSFSSFPRSSPNNPSPPFNTMSQQPTLSTPNAPPSCQTSLPPQSTTQQQRAPPSHEKLTTNREKFTFTPYIPNTKYIDEKNERANQEYQRFKDSLTSKVKEPSTKASVHIKEEHQKHSGYIRQELEDIKSLLLSSRQEMNLLLYNSRTTHNSYMSAYPTTSPFEMKL